VRWLLVALLAVSLGAPGVAWSQEEPPDEPGVGVIEDEGGDEPVGDDEPADGEEPVDGDDAYVCEPGGEGDYVYCVNDGGGGSCENCDGGVQQEDGPPPPPAPAAVAAPSQAQALPATTLPLTGGSPLVVALVGLGLVLMGAGGRLVLAR
jgi:hypothetical protein